MRFKRDGKEHIAIKEISLADGTIIGVFEGSRGANPDHDILIKYQESGKRLRTPKHIHWVISGSECVSAKKLGLNHIGFEINPKYIEIAEQRLTETKREVTLNQFS